MVVLAVAGGCSIKKPAPKYYFDQHIQPIFNNFCSSNTSPCHSIDRETGTALGNLDLSSFEGVQRRRDVLRTYGSYPLPLLLLKAVPEASVVFPYRGRQVQSEVRHAGGKSIAYGSDAFFELQMWLRAGATRDGVPPTPKANEGEGSCNTDVPADRDLSGVDVNSTSYMRFVSLIAPRLSSSCAFATCHSSPQSDFYITCGSSEQQQKFNYLQASGFIASAPTPVEQSEILLRPLAPDAGGVSHTGGTYIFSRNPDDENWTDWKAWADAVQADRAAAAPPPALSTGQKFFEENVMPKMLQRGCALEGCHSPDGFNDFRLRSGAQGFFAPRALQRNYETTLREFMSLDTVDVRQSRAVKKTTFARYGGIIHRAGAVLEDEEGVDGGGVPGSTPTPCPATFDPATATAVCTFAEWHRLERTDRAASVSAMASGSTLPIAFVARPPDGDSPLAFDTFRGGADLMIADATMGAGGAVTAVANARSVLGSCAGLTAGTADVRGPEWSADGTKLVFAGRPSAGGGLDLWVVDIAAGGAASGCRQLTTDNGRMQGLAKVHNFDPVFAPDGTIVFASTRAGTLTPKQFLPNADLYRSGPAANFGSVEQMTYLLGSELAPTFMQDGRVSFTAEKATPNFYQLSGRRINWDLTDYHPLLAQRAKSTDTFSDVESDSVGFTQATDIREGLDRNFLLILSNVGAQGGGGALATFNRSIGPFERGRGGASFLHSVQFVDPAATGVAGTAGVYRSPFSLPNGEILASYAANVTDPMATAPKYDLVAVNPNQGAAPVRRSLLSDGSRSYVDAVMGYKRSSTELFRNLPQLVFGGHSSSVDYAIMHFPDVPVLATLLGANLRRGRNVERFDAAVALKVYEERPPPSASPGNLQGPQNVYVDRQPLGSIRFESDHSLKVYMPTKKPLILELIDSGGNPVFTMTEEHQVSPGEYVTPGVPRKLFNGVCGGCHGSLTGDELDIAVTPDALTGASVSRSRGADPRPLE